MNYFWTEGFSSVLLNFQAQRFLLLFPVFYWMLKFTCLIIRGRVLYILNFDSYQKLLFYFRKWPVVCKCSMCVQVIHKLLYS